MNPVYLDYNATAVLRPGAQEAMVNALALTGNPSSVHGFGRAARKVLEDARAQVGALVGVRALQVIFNAGGTESNNTILSGFAGKRVLVSAIEHLSVLESRPGAEKIPVTRDGVVDLTALQKMLANGEAPALISVQLVNSETGVIQPVKEIAALAKTTNTLVHTDAVQAAGRIPVDFNDLGVDYMTLSAHKIGGPQGAGAIIFREGLQVPNLIKGGGQERRQRAGTENVAAIAGFGAAAAIALDELDRYAAIGALRDKLERALRQARNDIVIYGEGVPRIANTANIGLAGVLAETQIMAMDLAGIAVSSGSACSSGSFKPSHVLMAMGVAEKDAKSALRFSLGWATTDADIDRAIAAWTDMAIRTAK